MAHINNYNPVAKFLHWSIVLLIINNYILGLTLDANSIDRLLRRMIPIMCNKNEK